MNNKQKQFAIALTGALAARNPSDDDMKLIEIAKKNLPKLFVKCQALAPEVRRRVDLYMLFTWKESVTND